MSMANSARVKASVFHDAARASNWQWSKTGGASGSRCVCEARVAPSGPASARWYIIPESSTACTSPRASAASASTSPSAVSPCFPRSRSWAATLPGVTPCSANQCRGTTCPWGESDAPVPTRLPARSATLAMPASWRATTTVRKSRSQSRIPSETVALGACVCSMTCASGPFHAMSISLRSRIGEEHEVEARNAGRDHVVFHALPNGAGGGVVRHAPEQHPLVHGRGGQELPTGGRLMGGHGRPEMRTRRREPRARYEAPRQREHRSRGAAHA
mmetsp:Transcript_33934/g.80358  ORF Transcript_33934/g.80358 Transcript_33934/m.80358 type:complete len:273 (-) Transcript_33934:41-859(-)